ncbi:MAG TPA: M48 family metallopeptidase [Solimonas sp.]|nr:M48 family metallopeptidase [Solimonas sp.]
MSQAAPADNFKVTLTGRRLNPIADQEINLKLQKQFSITPDQAAQLLTGPLIVRQALELRLAAKVASALRACGLEAMVEGMDGSIPVLAPPVGAARMPGSQTGNAFAAFENQSMPQAGSTQRLPGEWLAVIGCSLLLAVYPGLALFFAGSWLAQLVAVPQEPGGWLVYVLVAVAGGALLLLLLKPLLARSSGSTETLQLDAESEPELLRGVETLARALDVPPPDELRLAQGTGATLRLQNGWRSLKAPRTSLTIGLPLFAGMNTRALLGVVAHELGRGAQGSSRRRWLLVYAICAWLERAAYTPDRWDERLEQWLEQPASPALKGLAQACAPAIRLQRLLLEGLQQLSARLSRNWAWQLETHADLCEAWAVGSRQSRLTARNLGALAQVADETEATNLQGWQEGRLLKNMAIAVGARFQAMDIETLRAIEDEIAEPNRRHWDSHPADHRRLDRVEQENLPGVYQGNQPAKRLLRQFEQWGEQLTEAHYRKLGLSYTAEQLSEQAGSATAKVKGPQHEALDRFFNSQFQPWPLLDLEVPADPDLAALGWQGVIDLLRRRSPEITDNWQIADEQEQWRPSLLAAAALGMKPSQLGVTGLDHLQQGNLWMLLEQIRLRDSDAHHHLLPDLRLHACRIDHAVRALPDQSRLPAEILRTLLRNLRELELDAAALQELQSACTTLEQLIASGGHPEAAKDFREALRLYGGHAQRLLDRGEGIAQSLAAGGSVSGYLLSCCPLAGKERMGDAQRYQRESRELASAFQQLYQLALVDLIKLCEQAEREQGIRPIRRLDPSALRH